MFFKNVLILAFISLLTRTCSTPLPEESRNQLLEFNERKNKSYLVKNGQLIEPFLASHLYDLREGKINLLNRSVYMDSLTLKFRDKDSITCRDMRRPIIHISGDGTFAYVITQKELKFLSGSNEMNANTVINTNIETELQIWEIIDGKWQMVVVSTNQ